MSALEVSSVIVAPVEVQPRLHVVRDGEVSSAWKRKLHARMVARTQAIDTAKTAISLASVAVVVATGFSAMVWAFLAVPNLPLP